MEQDVGRKCWGPELEQRQNSKKGLEKNEHHDACSVKGFFGSFRFHCQVVIKAGWPSLDRSNLV